MNEEEYIREIIRQRNIGISAVGGMLDNLCREYGWDPIRVWRKPRFLEAGLRRAAETYSIPHRFMAGMPVTRPEVNIPASAV